MKREPYFMKDKSWYYYDEKEEIIKLTSKAPKEAIDSYNEWYNNDGDNIIEMPDLKELQERVVYKKS